MMITKDCKYKLFFLQLYSSCVADCLLCFSFWFQEVAAECKKAGYTGVLVPIKCDLSKEEKILSMFAAIKEQHKGVDVCINNAGLARPDQLLNGKTGGWKTMLDVNVIGLSICTREAYQSMKERNVDDGHIIHINSMSGHRTTPMADIHFYSATKFAVTALTEGLRQELREAKSHIRATVSQLQLKKQNKLILKSPSVCHQLHDAKCFIQVRINPVEHVENCFIHSDILLVRELQGVR
uniref:Dehydrogenase/reductase (SDR family) member 11b n=1 Tax=Stegastes partitus TaxID=144197 RepID=A0A3B5BBN0_9TELE